MFQFFFGIQVACRVIRVHDHDTFRAGSDYFLDFTDWGQGEVILDRRSNGFYLYTAHQGESRVVCVEWFGDNNFVTRVQCRHESDRDGFRASGRDHDVIFIDVDTDVLVIFG